MDVRYVVFQEHIGRPGESRLRIVTFDIVFRFDEDPVCVHLLPGRTDPLLEKNFPEAFAVFIFSAASGLTE